MLTLLFVENREEWPCEQFSRVSSNIPAARVQKALRFRRWQDRQESLLGYLLLVWALDQNGSIGTLADIEFTPQGRPWIPGGNDFNISHTTGGVCCAVCSNGRVGIDIEHIRLLDPKEFDDVLSADEKTRIAAAPEPSLAFLEIWTVKEAVAKAAGNGILGPTPDTGRLTDWHVIPFHSSAFVGALAHDGNSRQDVLLVHLEMDAGGELKERRQADSCSDLMLGAHGWPCHR